MIVLVIVVCLTKLNIKINVMIVNKTVTNALIALLVLIVFKVLI